LETVPGATARNWDSYGHKVTFDEGIDETTAIPLLADPQTNGGLLVATNDAAALKDIFSAHGLADFLIPVGRCVEKKEKTVYIMP
jgi:selenide,water dikinase